MRHLLLLHDLSVQISWLALKNAKKAGFGMQTKSPDGIACNLMKRNVFCYCIWHFAGAALRAFLENDGP
jgi:hypothetical protein